MLLVLSIISFAVHEKHVGQQTSTTGGFASTSKLRGGMGIDASSSSAEHLHAQPPSIGEVSSELAKADVSRSLGRKRNETPSFSPRPTMNFTTQHNDQQGEYDAKARDINPRRPNLVTDASSSRGAVGDKATLRDPQEHHFAKNNNSIPTTTTIATTHVPETNQQLLEVQNILNMRLHEGTSEDGTGTTSHLAIPVTLSSPIVEDTSRVVDSIKVGANEIPRESSVQELRIVQDVNNSIPSANVASSTQSVEIMKQVPPLVTNAEQQQTNPSLETVPITSAKPTEPFACDGSIDPFETQPIENFQPPAKAPFDLKNEWKDAVKDMLASIRKMKVGGQILRDHLKNEVRRMEKKRYDMFCTYIAK